MPTANIIKTNCLQNSFRVKQIIDRHELGPKSADLNLRIDLPIEKTNWQIGIICGSSGSGKSTIAKELFPESYIREFKYGEKAIIDEVALNVEVNEISQVFNSVGFGTIWNWLKPYSVLSCGEKMRVDLARAILEDRSLIVFDEFTSVVDRGIAKVASFAIAKAIRKRNKQFIAVTCHRDIIEWLEPDWIYDTDKKEFFFVRGKSQDQNCKLKLENAPQSFGRVLKTCII